MKLKFDDCGNLLPYDILDINLYDFEENFVFNEHRKQLFAIYLQIIIDLKTIGIEHFTHWINGSFTTLKPFPNDIDVVTIVDFTLYNAFEKELLALKKRYKESIDLYFLVDYPENHKNSIRTQFDKTEWRFLFSTDRKKKAKGFISINF
jgi:hypothetical protein